MAYSTPVDVRNALAPQGDSTGTAPPSTPSRTAADLSDTQLADAIAEADSLIDSCIVRFYATPVARSANGEIPVPIRWWSRNIAAYNATLTWRKGKDLSPSDPVALRYAQTLAALYATRDGKQTLDLPAATGGTAGGAGQVNNQYAGDLFGVDDFNLVPFNPGWPYFPDFPPRW